MIQSSPRTSAQIHLFSRRVRRWAVCEEKYDHAASWTCSATPLWQEPDPELITQLQQIYLDVEGDLEDM